MALGPESLATGCTRSCPPPAAPRLPRARSARAADGLYRRPGSRGDDRLRLTGANQTDIHLRGVNPAATAAADVADLRNVVAGDACPRCGKGTLEIARGIEVGHVFKLGTKYSEKMGVTFLDEKGETRTDGDGLLRHRRHAHGGRGHRAEPRRQGHHLARSDGAVPGGDHPDGLPAKRCGQGRGGEALRRALRAPAWRSSSTTATSARACCSRTRSSSASRTAS